MNYLHQETTEQIIKCFYEVYNHLSYGFLEKVYEHAMIIELESNGLHVKNQNAIKVYYKSKLIGDCFADIVVDNLVVLELKAAESIAEEHEFQLINYLKATNIEIGLLLNFGKKPGFAGKFLQMIGRTYPSFTPKSLSKYQLHRC